MWRCVAAAFAGSNCADVPWSDLDRFDVQEGHLMLYANKSFWFTRCKSIALAGIPNYVALLEMLRPQRAVCF